MRIGAALEQAGAVHGVNFGAIRPALVAVEVGALAAPDLLVEIELDAIIGAALPAA